MIIMNCLSTFVANANLAVGTKVFHNLIVVIFLFAHVSFICRLLELQDIPFISGFVFKDDDACHL